MISRKNVFLLKELSKNKNLIISKPDKGRGVVLTDKVNYINSMNTIISDASKFSIITDPIEKFSLRIEDKINNFLRKIKKLELIPQDVINKLFVSGSGPGILYGLPKIHKLDFSSKFQFRPIFAAYNCPSYNLAKFLVPVLNPITSNQFTCLNSYQFVKDISSVERADRYIMASFDVESLYTNIPLSETIQICLSKLYTNPASTVLGLSKNMFKSLLELAVKHSYFVFNNVYYKQNDGLGMGLPLSPSFANIFLCHYEELWLSNCPTAFKPAFYRRYIDDTFLLFHDKSHIKLFLNYMNCQHQSINFTCEIENNSCISFLDSLIHRNSKQFECSVYRKNSFSGLGTSFYSFCHFRFKINSIKTLLARAYGVCSNYSFLHKEFEFLVQFFRSNGYCSSFVKRQINLFLNRKYSTDQPVVSNNKLLYVSMPYFGPQSVNLEKDLSKLLHKYFINIDFKIVLTNSFRIGSFFNYKDKLPTSMLNSVIYDFGCEQCSSHYVGMTTRNFFMRLAEHAGRSFRTNIPLSTPPHSAIRDHTSNCNSPISINQFKIIDSCSNPIDLRILESLHIFTRKPVLNNSLSSYPLAIVNR